jgi:hypothetical protein
VTDRSQAISLVEAAFTSGRIVQADRDMRIDQIKNASSDQDIDLVIRDLQVQPAATAVTTTPTTVAGGATPPAAGQQPPWPLVNYGPQQGLPVELTAMTGASKKIGGIIAVVVLLAVMVPVVGVVIALVSAKDTFEDINFGEPVNETTYLPGQQPDDNGVNVHTIEGFAALVGALEEKTGSTEVFDAVLYPRYAVLYVPEETTGKRYQYHYWDGITLEPNDSKSTSDSRRIDLATVDAGVMVTLLETIRGRIEDPTSWYVSINRSSDGQPQLSVHSSNEYGEGAYILATFAGEITYESTYE